MSMNTTDDVLSSSATFFATVDLPEPEPPAIPIINGFVMMIQSYEAGVWNALCFFRSRNRLPFVRQYNEKTFASARLAAVDGRRVQHLPTQHRYQCSDWADNSGGRQPGLHRYEHLRRQELTTNSPRHGYRSA